jgi:tetratricopeptide (TPR) repeat protein
MGRRLILALAVLHGLLGAFCPKSPAQGWLFADWGARSEADLLCRADSALERNSLDLALRLYKRAAARNPASAHAAYGIAVTSQWLGRYRAARDYAESVLSMEGDYMVNAMDVAVNMNLHLGDPDRARAAALRFALWAESRADHRIEALDAYLLASRLSNVYFCDEAATRGYLAKATALLRTGDVEAYRRIESYRTDLRRAAGSLP